MIAIGFDLKVRILPDWWISSVDCKFEHCKAVRKIVRSLNKIGNSEGTTGASSQPSSPVYTYVERQPPGPHAHQVETGRRYLSFLS